LGLRPDAIVVGNDTPNGGKNFLHRRLLSLCRLRHCRTLVLTAQERRSQPRQGWTAGRPCSKRITTLKTSSRHDSAKYRTPKTERKQGPVDRLRSTARMLATIGRANADPAVAHLLVVDLRIVNRRCQSQHA